jgi:hypothetical protein
MHSSKNAVRNELHARAVRDELRLRELLDLPIEKRAGAADEFRTIIGRLLLPFEPYVRRLASPNVRLHEEEDVAQLVLVAAAECLQQHFSHPREDHPRGWRHHEDTFEKWFTFFCGWPFQGRLAGEITNAIRKIWRARQQLASVPADEACFSVPLDEASDAVGEQTVNPEQAIIEAEDEDEDELKANLLELGQELEKLERVKPRRAFMMRLEYGVHTFSQLDANVIVSLAKHLKFAGEKLALVRTIAKRLAFSEGQRTLTQDQIGELTGVSDRTVRTELSKGKEALMAGIRARREIKGKRAA